MTSTPVSLNDESLEGSWIDIRSAKGGGDSSPEFLRRSPYSMVESVQNLGLLSFQVERFLLEANSQRQASHQNGNSQSQQNIAAATSLEANCTSPNCLSDTEASYDNLDAITYMNSLRIHNKSKRDESQNQDEQQQDEQTEHQQQDGNITNANNSNVNQYTNIDLSFAKAHFRPHDTPVATGRGPKTFGDCVADQLSDSLSFLSRASAIGDTNLQDFDWMWDWAAQPEYFSGQEWKVYAPKQEYLMRQRQLYCADLEKRRGLRNPYSGDMVSVLFLSNLLSIIIGAGITYSILARRNGGL